MRSFGNFSAFAKTILISEKSESLANELLEKMYLLPNLPADIVPVGKTPEENLNVFEEGTVPVLHEGAQPHWDLVKKYDIIHLLIISICILNFSFEKKLYCSSWSIV